jgi:hypothetical protein
MEKEGDALGRLPALIREALLLRYRENMTLEEIARVVSAPLPTVKSRIYRWQTGFAAIAPLSWRDIHRRSRRLVLRRPAPSAEESNPRPL